ncbi:hypothetical protein SPRG_17689 [Saprolegnia parasitica CBS 223.65]|uniref:Protein OSCP1 n=1 Tax=Saprolegnia parasitica (strain CBS 223.65) TaxID=695850 RepID=A0A067BQ78_SAPPC|nr:hypothetical protein SPRG_17689 [Saprolegnia parasitica CBS 223.65]KDO16827.1 hypothetical protein SPRG_17689 [Saprolegnia parasitica CBS 223.65]|eukprot:XP_012212465.1 hypothetical protein SPRG_17689 [Saprolegnia parasitica CBS 223.65]
MTSGALLAMPMLLINMGGEMIYVLDQRLKAQNIPEDKSTKVLVDVVKTMYNTKFISELFRPHHMYSNLSTRQIFDRLAHSSIMRLNQSSMDKLYGLMRMGFKSNLLACSSADQLVQVTMNHLQSIKAIVKADEATSLIEDAVVLTASVYGALSHANFLLLKQHLARFFQDVRIKVSLFLQAGLQNPDGAFVLRAHGPIATGGDIPGVVRYFDDRGKVVDKDMFDLANAVGAIAVDDGPILTRDPALCPFGENLYAPTAKPDLKSGAELTADAKRTRGADKLDAPAKQYKATAQDGLNLLADLLGNSAKETTDAKPFKIALFAGDTGDDDDATDGKGTDAHVTMITIDALSDHKDATKHLLDDFDVDVKARAEGKKGGDDDDLLSLMDASA